MRANGRPIIFPPRSVGIQTELESLIRLFNNSLRKYGVIKCTADARNGKFRTSAALSVQFYWSSAKIPRLPLHVKAKSSRGAELSPRVTVLAARISLHTLSNLPRSRREISERNHHRRRWNNVAKILGEISFPPSGELLSKLTVERSYSYRATRIRKVICFVICPSANRFINHSTAASLKRSSS